MSFQKLNTKDEISKHLKDYIKNNIESWINETILLEMNTIARAANMPMGFIKGIILVKNSNGYKINNDWKGKNGEPLAKWFEYGTVDHFIRPRTKLALHWSNGFGTSSFPQFDVVKGTAKFDKFSKGHKVSGIKPYNTMNKGYSRGIKKLKTLIRQKTKQFSKSLEQKYNLKVKT